MSEVTVRLKIPEEILKKVDLDKIVERVQREITLEYNIKKLYGKFRGKNLNKILDEVENEWGT